MTQDPALKQVYKDAAEHIAGKLEQYREGSLTRSHLSALSKGLQQAADAINSGINNSLKNGITKAIEAGAKPLHWQMEDTMQKAGAGFSGTTMQWGFAAVNEKAVEAYWARAKGGLTLSDRIWNVSQNARDSMARVLSEAVAMGRDPVAVARDLRQYINYGAETLAAQYPNMMQRMKGRGIPRDLSYEGLRLARTEMSSAFMEGTYAAGYANPFYTGVRWLLSSSHPRPDECDDLAEQDTDHLGAGCYAPGNEPQQPHPSCLCTVAPMVDSSDEAVERTKRWIAGEPDEALDKWYDDVYMGGEEAVSADAKQTKAEAAGGLSVKDELDAVRIELKTWGEARVDTGYMYHTTREVQREVNAGRFLEMPDKYAEEEMGWREEYVKFRARHDVLSKLRRARITPEELDKLIGDDFTEALQAFDNAKAMGYVKATQLRAGATNKKLAEKVAKAMEKGIEDDLSMVRIGKVAEKELTARIKAEADELAKTIQELRAEMDKTTDAYIALCDELAAKAKVKYNTELDWLASVYVEKDPEYAVLLDAAKKKMGAAADAFHKAKDNAPDIYERNVQNFLAELRELGYNGTKKVNLDGVNGKATKETVEGFLDKALAKLPKEWAEKSCMAELNLKSVERGYYQRFSNVLALDPSSADAAETMLHEMGHRMQDKVGSALTEMERKFYNRRTKGEELKRLKDVTFLAYRDDEVTRVDKWFNPYMGKHYSSSAGPGVFASEITPMGLEGLYYNYGEAWAKDPETIQFMLGVLLSL
jgi:hypothetical protein